MLKLLAWVAGTLLVLIGLGLGYLQFADLRAPVEWAAGRLLDRELRLDGAFEVDLLPAPRILAEGVTLGNASWSDEPVMLRAEHLSARVDGWSLLAGPRHLSGPGRRSSPFLPRDRTAGEPGPSTCSSPRRLGRRWRSFRQAGPRASHHEARADPVHTPP
jgi:hypothetical protein